MPPRIPILGALRQAKSSFPTQTCQFSKSARCQALKPNVPSATNRMLDLDSSPITPTTSSADTNAPRTSTNAASDLYSLFRASKDRQQNPTSASQQQQNARGGSGNSSSVVDTETELRGKIAADDYMRQWPRRWNSGEVYAPHDLSWQEAKKYRRNTPLQRDLVDLLGLNPLDMYRNFSFISEYITPHGRIRSAQSTGLRPKNQRKVAKAIRRAIGLGLHPSVHHHPELLMRRMRNHAQQNAPTGKVGSYI